MVKVEIRCPSCDLRGNIEVLEEALKGVTRGLLAVNIPDGTICEHTFIVYIDRNLAVRDYFMADFKIELPDIPIGEDIKEKIISSKDITNLDLIKLNLTAILLANIMKAIFAKQKILIIYDHDFLYEHIHNFFDYITQDAFEVNIEIMSKETYKKKKKEFKDHMIFEGHNILNNVGKKIDPKKLKVEKQLIKTFLSETDLSYSYIILKNEIHKAYKLSKSIVDYKKARDLENLNLKTVVDFITDEYGIKLQKTYLHFIIDIISDYYEVEVAGVADVADFLGFI